MAANGNTGLILQLQRFSLDDGPGIRTTLFLKGCNLHCLWCHNPESIHPYAELAFTAERCIRCSACTAVCTHAAQVCNTDDRCIDRTACVRCMECVKSCPAGALAIFGREMTVEQVIKEILRDRAFYARSGGGVTFSGGEPMLQRPFLQRLLVACKEHGLHTAVDTAGNVPAGELLAILPLVDLFLYDIKAFDPAIHRRCTGTDNRRILENLLLLGRSGARIWIRLPYIPGLNNDGTEISAVSALLKDTPGIERVELLPCHRYGQSKYAALGLPCPYEVAAPPDDDVRRVLALYRGHGLAVECPTLK